jgi:predicted NUDIX family NTP pyrophosphohydrolase
MSNPAPSFYDRLPVLENFAAAADPDRYVPVPDDWAVAVGDVRDSTGAIDEGLYEEVNMVGASVIAATLNAVGHRSLPYVFGGDGAALCVPGDAVDAVERALGGARRMAREEFGLRLDVGLVPVADLVRAGHSVLVARYRLSAPIEQAVFMGRGLPVAEEWVKARPDGPYGVPPSVDGPADFSGLECRWDHVPSHREEIVALLVRATGTSLQETAAIYDDVIATLRDLYGGEDRRPVLHGQLRMTFAPQKLATEQRVRTHGAGWGRRLAYWPTLWLQNALGAILMATGWTTSETAWGRYKQDLEARTDFRKMDGTLRQVIAGTQAQREQLEAYLQAEYEKGRLVYGLDASDAAMVTCLVFQYEEEHVHFVDGADGGYAHAARALKDRAAARGR